MKLAILRDSCALLRLLIRITWMRRERSKSLARSASSLELAFDSCELDYMPQYQWIETCKQTEKIVDKVAHNLIHRHSIDSFWCAKWISHPLSLRNPFSIHLN